MTRDILILGGGPAGISTALHLIRLAPEFAERLLVLERARYPRHKLCGGALTVDAEAILQRLGLDVTEVPHVDAERARFDFRGEGLTYKVRSSHALRMIRRDEFDAWLASKARRAGVEIREGVTAHSVELRADAAMVHTDAGTFEAEILVGADGSNGITRRTLLPDAPIHTARLLEVVVPAAAGPSAVRWRSVQAAPGSAQADGSDQNSLTQTGGRGGGWGHTAHAVDTAYFDFGCIPLGIAGYTWDFPTQVKGAPMRCWGIYDTNLLADHDRPALREPLEAQMRRNGAGLEGADLQGHPIRWFSPRSALSAPRLLLVGDAAGADGIFGEGISTALGFGAVAAEAIREAIARHDYSFRHYRRRVLLSPVGRALTARALLTHALYGLHWNWSQRLIWHMLKPLVGVVAYFFVLNWARRMK